MSTFQTLNPQLYFCHQCDNTVSISPNPNSNLSCPHCNGDFLEEINTSSNDPNPNPNPNPFPALLSAFFNSTAASATRPSQFTIPPSMFSSSSGGGSGIGGVGGFDPLWFMESFIADQQANGLNIQFSIESSDGSSRVPANIGDYFFGAGFEQILQHIAENDPNRYGTPPAAKTAVEGLPSVVVGEEVVNSESNSCAVCMTEFEVNSEVKQMPCKHLYHTDCILPWLQLHNSCPVCRFELPTDDQDYETRKTGGGDGSGSGRTLNIPLPWLVDPPASFRGNNDGDSSDGGETSGFWSLD